jgi:leucyl aminopeptidase
VEIKLEAGSIKETEADAIVVFVFEGIEHPESDAAEVDTAIGGIISQLMVRGEIKGKLNKQIVIHSPANIPASKLVVLGLGKKETLTADRVRGGIAEVCRVLEQVNVRSIASVLPGTKTVSDFDAVQAMVEGALLGTYSFRRHITREADHGKLNRLTIIVPDSSPVADLENAKSRGEIIARATSLARDMVNEPSNYMTPVVMAETANKIAGETGLNIEILEQEQMQKLGMGAMLGVAQGSRQPPKFIVLKYNGTSSKEIDIALIGKAITFDSGGISIKPSSGMEEMKDDMSGGAAVIATMGAIAQLKPAINIVGLVAATENLPDGSAVKPGDILTAMDGKTIEVISTDAEGRLTLADAISYALKLGARNIVDVATLTGAMIVALSNVCSGAFTNNQALCNKVIAAGKQAGECIWQMPMCEEYKELNESEVADIKNVGGRNAGSITAAHFLGEFVEDVPWVHLDIAGTVWTDKAKNYLTKGATGVPVRTLINLVTAMAES